VEFPEAVRHLALAGAELVLVPTALPDTPDAAFIAEKVVPVRAFENGIAIAYANHAGGDGRFGYAGLSCIAFPNGSDGARAPANGSTVIIADYNPADFAPTRLTNPYVADRRVDLFEPMPTKYLGKIG
jgi:predicted amidohydrolase